MDYFKPESRKARLVEPKNMNVELSSNNRTPLLIYTMGRFAGNKFHASSAGIPLHISYFSSSDCLTRHTLKKSLAVLELEPGTNYEEHMSV